MNKIFVIEGTDGTGKETQTSLTYERLVKNGIPVYRTSFPNYDSDSSAPVKMYLKGLLGDNANSVPEKPASAFYAVDRYITYITDIKQYYEDDKTIILLDRYVSSNLLHQGSKIIARGESFENLDAYANWLHTFEFKDMELPKPTATFFLYLPVDYSLKSMEARTNKFTHETKKDIHETDKFHLENATKSGYYLAEKLGWNIINCLDEKGDRRTREDINDEIYSILQNFI